VFDLIVNILIVKVKKLLSMI